MCSSVRKGGIAALICCVVAAGFAAGWAQSAYRTRGRNPGPDSAAQSSIIEAGTIFVASQGCATFGQACGAITAYARASSGNIAPILQVAGAQTQLGGPSGVAIDSQHNLYVSNQWSPGGPDCANGTQISCGSITEYRDDSDGDVAPLASITGSNTLLRWPSGVALDSAGNIYVLGQEGVISEFAAGSNGNLPPLNRIAGYDTQLRSPKGIALDRSENIYATSFTDYGVSSVLEFAAGSSGRSEEHT